MVNAQLLSRFGVGTGRGAGRAVRPTDPDDSAGGSLGDEQLPDDCEWSGKPLKRWPEWFTQHTARPVPERITFTTWRHYTRTSPLADSGLLGPVTVRFGQRVPAISR